MEILPVSKFKSNFSTILNQVRQGKEVGVSYGRNKKEVAVLVSSDGYKPKRTLGLIQDKAQIKFAQNFQLTEEEFLNS